MNSMVIETDMVRNYVGSLLIVGQQQGLVIGLLYLHKGNWNGGRFLTKLGKILSKTILSEEEWRNFG
jgi:hypothetical protein